ncbi:MAG TPA: hypothetical protein DCL44_09710 [Elusimicrobia bacterium]|nr:hypothetical protein [Elusimicrobiota bacterium]
MKYEAKNVGGVATSQADVTPWSYINHPTAVAACAALGAGHHLITIAEAQTINRNIEAQSANWANGIIGSLVSAGGGLKRGNVGITDSASYAGGAAEYGASRNLKAKLVLSNGEEIWDWSGNVWEWIYGTGAGGTLGAPDGVAFYATSAWYEWNSVTPDLNQERPVLGPSNSNWTGAYGVGSYYGGAPTKAPRRGGPWADGAFAGVFSFCAEASTSDSINTFGFRCGKSPDTQAPTVPTNLSAVAVSSSQINLSWTASTDNVGVTNYKIYRNGGVTPIAMPTGTTYSNTGLTASTAYSYTVSACDAVDNCSGQSSSASDTTPTPPAAGGEWVFVPGNSSIGTNDFWVMQYEAKNVSGIATSQAVITPWVNIDLSSSIAACSALGSGYHLLTIAEAQTVNRNIEAQTANWANGIIGSLVSAGGGLKRGNLSITDSASYIGATPEFGTGRDAKAKLVLSNGGEIWDWSGNVSEWIYGAGATGTQGTPGGVTFNTSGWYDWSSTSPDLSQERPLLGPSNSSWTSAYGVGKYFGGLTTNAVIRGGGWPDDVSAGVFTFNAFYAPSSSLVSNGFRCGR